MGGAFVCLNLLNPNRLCTYVRIGDNRTSNTQDTRQTAPKPLPNITTTLKKNPYCIPLFFTLINAAVIVPYNIIV